MNKITLTKKSGFRCRDPLFYIYDYRGVPFYTNETLIKKDVCFNLPAGIYFSDANLEKLPKCVKQKSIELPPPQRDIGKIRYKIEFGENVNKATVFYLEKRILFDKVFKQLPLPFLMFALFHEYGHRFYKTEKYADLYAMKAMLNIGYNISQIKRAQVIMLSSKQIERKLFLYKI